ncbi:helix-turn-helix transcriptional regulator [Herbaspirillum sp. LeCh32-8]|uniref:helix-turn-helix domain-containing protein n=1 Tax=Herbaspirillum sp. LeCh32-8 TaxID=2821356 RepID=UPI001AE302CC|nr:helix-turn-helix transcriptional regulator [Herbaspirillum sp. LeCh32-8]MBP0597748.1 helix-turn-helix transcriptional regulator [Herbaspirillum sp. LeCh32-8]
MSKKAPSTVFGVRLRQARLHADIPQDRLGVQIGLDETTASARISRYETGVHEPPFEVAKKIGAALSIPAAFFYCEDDALADVVLAWGILKKKERERAKVLLQELSGAK